MEKIETSITRLFNIKYPIVSAPMFLVSNVDMVVATGNAGGLGTFPAFNFRPIENFRKTIKEIKSKTKAPFGVNLIVNKSNKYLDEQLEVCLEEEVALIISSLGGPHKVLKRVKGTKTKVFCDVVGIEHAKKCKDLGADGLIAVSSGAGGHAGDISAFALIPALKEKIGLPLIAAGSIVDGKGMAASFSLGADAIYMGTRMIASKEAQVPSEYKKAIIEANAEDIINTAQVDGFPGNFIKTPFLEKAVRLTPSLIEVIASQSKRVKKAISMIRAGKSLMAPEKVKASYKTVFSAGHGVGLISEVLSIEEIIQNTVNEYLAIKKTLP